MPVTPSVPSVLVVDDEADLRAVVADVLAVEPLRVLQAPDGRRALELVSADPPTVMILDLKMPEVGGMEVLRQLKTLAPKLPVIVLTGVEDVRTAVAAMRLGAYDYTSGSTPRRVRHGSCGTILDHTAQSAAPEPARRGYR